MKYGQHLESKRREEWKDAYIDYKGLKDLIKACAHEAETGEASFSPRTTSLTIARYNNRTDSAEERFFTKLEGEVERVNNFTSRLVDALRSSLKNLSARVEKEPSKENVDQLLAEAKRIGDEFLALEKYVNLNYMGFHKILKKHDKCLPHAPCRQFYVSHLHQQPWVQGNYSDLLVSLSGIYSKLRGDTTGEKNEDAAQGFTRSTTKYWVRNEDVSTVKHHVLQHLPVFQFDKNNFAGDAQLVNSVYLDNSSCELYHGRLDKKPGAIALRIRWYGNLPPDFVFVERKTHKESWKGEESVKERFTIPEDKVVAFIDGEYTVDEALHDMEQAAKKKGRTVKEEDKVQFADMFTEVFNAVDSKQLRPFVRTQYMRTAFQIPFDATVRVSLDTNLCMIRENPEDGPTCAASGRWYRDPTLPIHRTEITRFPHAVLEVKLSLPEGMTAPSWVQELLDSGYLTQVHKFSKFIHGSATLFPDMVRAVPYWVDDESLRASMVASAPPAPGLPSTSDARKMPAMTAKPRVDRKSKTAFVPSDELSHPLLGNAPTLRLMPGPEEVHGFGNAAARINNANAEARTRAGAMENSWLHKILRSIGLAAPTQEQRNRMATAQTQPMRLEPKTFFANERTFLSWLHMAVTLGSISAALLGFAAGSDGDSHADVEGLSRNLVELISLILLPLAMAMCIYALYVFTWRATNIRQKKVTQFDDRYGPLCLCAAVVTALTAIFIISCIDFMEVLQGDLAPSPPPPFPGFPPPSQPPPSPSPSPSDAPPAWQPPISFGGEDGGASTF